MALSIPILAPTGRTSIYFRLPLSAAIGMIIYKFADKLGVCPDTRRAELMNTVIRDYENLISRICYGYAHDSRDFDDLRQDTYENIWQGLASFRGEASLKTWVYRITLNTCVSTIRKRSRQPVTVGDEMLRDMVDDDASRLSRLSDIYDAIRSLPSLDKAIIMLWLDDKSYDEIADIMGMNRNTVASRLRRAKLKMKDLM